MIKIKVSYEADRELRELVQILRSVLVECKISKNNKGKYKKAYISITDLCKWSVTIKALPLKTSKIKDFCSAAAFTTVEKCWDNMLGNVGVKI